MFYLEQCFSMSDKSIYYLLLTNGTMKTTTTFGIIAIVGLVASMNVASVAYGQEVSMSEETTFVNSRVTQLKETMEKFGFNEFEYIPTTQQVTASGFSAEITEDLADVIAEYYGFNVIDFGGQYLVVKYNSTLALVL